MFVVNARLIIVLTMNLAAHHPTIRTGTLTLPTFVRGSRTTTPSCTFCHWQQSSMHSLLIVDICINFIVITLQRDWLCTMLVHIAIYQDSWDKLSEIIVSPTINYITLLGVKSSKSLIFLQQTFMEIFRKFWQKFQKLIHISTYKSIYGMYQIIYLVLLPCDRTCWASY